MRVIVLNNDKVVIEVKDVKKNHVLLNNEIHSEIGEMGQIMQEDGTFITPEPELIPVQVTIEELILAENIFQTALLEMNMMGAI